MNKYNKSFLEVYDKKNGEIIRFINFEDMPYILKQFVVDYEISSFFYQDGEIVAEDFNGNEYDVEIEI